MIFVDFLSGDYFHIVANLQFEGLDVETSNPDPLPTA